MNPTLLDRAYSLARQKYALARREVSSALDKEFPDAGFDPIHRAAQRGLELHLAAERLAQRVWAKTFPYDKARETLRAQFSEFSAETCERALSEAYVQTR